MPKIRREPSNLISRKGKWSRRIRAVWLNLARSAERPRRIAAGFAIGAATSFTPLFGLHFILAAAIAYLARVNVKAAIVGTACGNPLTFPVFAAFSIALGNSILGGTTPSGDRTHFQRISDGFSQLQENALELMRGSNGADLQWEPIADVFQGILLPYLVGGVFAGVGAGIVIFTALEIAITNFRSPRSNPGNPL